MCTNDDFFIPYCKELVLSKDLEAEMNFYFEIVEKGIRKYHTSYLNIDIICCLNKRNKDFKTKYALTVWEILFLQFKLY